MDNHDEDRLASKVNNRDHLYSVYTLLFTLPGIPSIYYGSEWGIEGKRTRDSDQVLRPQISISEEATYHTDLTDYIAKLGLIHKDKEELQGGRYKEMLLTTSQYAFALFADQSVLLKAVNNDEAPAVMNIPVPIHASSAENLLDHTTLPINNGQVTVTITGGRGAVLKIREE